ncbi:RNA polymerase sigma factor [Eubacterium sp. MSJ-33]|uniref:RNA polymerase sigma factor n=1 Tax=Eubacterium sp. MSJ-33 TaxID=2841528 RepID=UPI0015ADA0BF|nr:RNA polymerase sigma factor [Eubacterium sp. MSJ-33]QWT52921.1 RNA polymerase sigma factor [Eubacterium sp. MSJ-33]
MEDHAGIAQLVEMYASMIYRIAYTRMQNVTDAEDITQEVLLKYLKAGKTFRDEEHRKMWLIRVTVNTIKSSLTSAWRRHTVALDDVTEPSYQQPDLPVLKEKVEKLPERYRLPMYLYYYEELSVKEIAHVIKSTEGTVKSLLSRGRKMLRDELKEDGYV